jgi:hypothetical protein
LLAEFAQLARKDASGLVRLVLASTLQRLPVKERAALAAPLLARAEDASDHNLPLMIWYGIAPLGDSNPTALVRLAGGTDWPLIQRHVARRVAALVEKNPAPIESLLTLAASKPANFQADVLAGMTEAFTGWRKAPKPAAWDALVAKLDAALAAPARELSALFGDGRALDEVKRIALDKSADLEARKTALQALVDARVPDLRTVCEQLLDERYINTVAIRGLAQESDPKLGAKLVGAYKSFALDDHPQVIAVLVTRPAWARTLLDAVAGEQNPAWRSFRISCTANSRTGRRLAHRAAYRGVGRIARKRRSETRTHGEAESAARAAHLANADLAKGRASLSAALRHVPHTLRRRRKDRSRSHRFRARQPRLPARKHRGPSAVVTADFRLTTLTLKDGRALAGVVAAKTDRTLTLRTMTDTQTIERAEIVKTEESPLSMMPEGLVEALAPEQVRDLFAYLMSRQQVPCPQRSRWTQ